MQEGFSHDVFLSHCSKDKAIVRSLAKRLKKSGIRVWFDEWEIAPGDSIPAKIEEGLARSYVILFCMSANVPDSDWAQYERNTYRYEDPLNKGRRFIPLRLDGAPIRKALAQFHYIDWRPECREGSYAKLLAACRKFDSSVSGEERSITQPNQDNRTDSMWRDKIAMLQRQFEARAQQSKGLHHLMVEAGDDERDRLAGPDWFRGVSDGQGGDPWHAISISHLPGVNPCFREVKAGEDLSLIPKDRLICDKSGVARAVFVPMVIRSSYLCGDMSQRASFDALASSASRILTDASDLADHPLSKEMSSLFRKPRGGLRYIFGAVPEQPPRVISCGWQAGMLIGDHGVLIDVPIHEDSPGIGHWLLFLHQIGWSNHKGCPLTSVRLAWNGNMTVPFELLSDTEGGFVLPLGLQDKIKSFSKTSYYSHLGDRQHPLDVNLASAFAIQYVLHLAET